MAEHWHRERLWGQLMTVLVRLGRRADALAVHRRAQEQLAERLRVQPGAELRAVEEAVINRDPMLFGVPLQPTSVPPALATTVPPCVGREEEVAWLLCGARPGRDPAGAGSARRRLARHRQVPPDRRGGPAGRGARRASIRYWRADARGLETHVAEPDRLSLVIVEDLDQAQHEDVARVAELCPVGDDPAGGHPRDLPRPGPGRRPLQRAEARTVRTGRCRGGRDRTGLRAVGVRQGRRVRDGQRRRRAGPGAPGRQRVGLRPRRAGASTGRSPTRPSPGAWSPPCATRSSRVPWSWPTYGRGPACCDRWSGRAGSPYPGLTGFGAGDVELFHGRERLVAEVLARMVEAPLAGARR